MTAHIMIVDDDVEALRLVGLMLEREGYNIHAATSGQQALEKLNQVTPDLIILDVMMPDMNGFTVAKHLRDDPSTQHIPILFFTAKSTIDDKVAGFQAGGDDYLTKPIHPAELLSRVEVLIQRGGRPVETTERGKVITFLPVKGGVGNSTLALNTALLLSDRQEEKKTLLVEYQDGGGSLALQMGSKSDRGLHNLTENAADLTTTLLNAQLMRHSAALHILPTTSKPVGMTPPIHKAFTQRLLSTALNTYDYLLFDLSARVDEVVQPILQRADYLLITMEPNRIALHLTQQIVEQLLALNIGEYKIKIELMYRAPSASAITRHDIQQQLHLEILGNMPPAPELAYDSWSTGRPMVTIQPVSLIAQQVKMVVEDILKTL
ncbi:MAG: response regulator [Anaerolineae bacterium]